MIDNRCMPRGGWGVAVSFLLGAVAGGCGTATRSLPGNARPGPSPATPPRVVLARRLGPSAPGGLPFGSRVSAQDLAGAREFADSSYGFALTSDLKLRGGGTYPAATNDGGRIWRIDGPILHINAAQGSIAVTEAGIEGRRFYYAWAGGANSVVDVTTDGGRHWWQAFLPGAVISITSDENEVALTGGLTAVVAGPTPDSSGRGTSLWTYHTTNGRDWRYGSTFNVTA